MKLILTDELVRTLPLPSKGSRITYDRDVPGFGIRITANAAKTYVVRYRVRESRRDRTYGIGPAAVWSADRARERACEIRRSVDEHGDPVGDIQEMRNLKRITSEQERQAKEIAWERRRHAVRLRAEWRNEKRRYRPDDEQLLARKRERKREQSRKYYWANVEHNREMSRKSARKYIAANKEKVREKEREKRRQMRLAYEVMKKFPGVL